MYNLVKMDLYRFVKTNLTKLLVILFVLAAGVVALQYMSISENENASVGTLDGDGSGFSLSLNNGSDSFLEKGMTLAQYMTSNGLGPMYVAIIGIMIILFSNADNKRGFRKNIAGLVGSKEQIYIAKIITGTVISFMYLSIAYLINFALGKVVLGEWLSLGNPLDLAVNFGGTLLSLIAFNIIFITITMISNSSIVAVVACLFVSLGVFGKLYSLITFGIMKVTDGVVVNVGKYMIDTWLTGTLNPDGNYLFVSVISIVWICFAVVLNIVILNKRDIR